MPCRHFLQCYGVDDFHAVLACFCGIFLNAYWCHIFQVHWMCWRSWYDALLHTLSERPVCEHSCFLCCGQRYCTWRYALRCMCCECWRRGVWAMLSRLRLHWRCSDTYSGERGQWCRLRRRNLLRKRIQQRAEVLGWVLQPERWPGELLRVPCRLILPPERH